jgi:hypothetical protein
VQHLSRPRFLEAEVVFGFESFLLVEHEFVLADVHLVQLRGLTRVQAQLSALIVRTNQLGKRRNVTRARARARTRSGAGASTPPLAVNIARQHHT